MRDLETLRGVFVELPFESLLGFLASTATTGTLEVRLVDHDLVRLYLNGGNVVGSDLLSRNHSAPLPLLPTADPQDLLMSRTLHRIFRLTTEPKTTFSFYLGASCPDAARHAAVEAPRALLEAAYQVDEWTRLPATLQTGETRFSVLADGEQVSLKLEQWEVLNLAREGLALAEIWERSRHSRLETARILHGLMAVQILRSLEPEATVPMRPSPVSQTTRISVESIQRDETNAGLLTGRFNTKALAEASEAARCPTVPPHLDSSAVLKELGVEKPRMHKLHQLTRIGRFSDNDIVLEVDGVSRHHAEIQRLGNVYVIQDLNSTNGVWIDGRQIRLEYLTKRCEIMIPPQRFLFEIVFEVTPRVGSAASA